MDFSGQFAFVPIAISVAICCVIAGICVFWRISRCREEVLEKPQDNHEKSNLLALKTQNQEKLEAIFEETTPRKTTPQTPVPQVTELRAMHNKTENAAKLLNELLPSSVAGSLLDGKVPQMETFENVTIFCSSIVGFGELQTRSTPHQIMYMINSLFTKFDKVLDNYKVYKLGATDDQYMVVSGLPERCEDHASQIAGMSLEMLQVAEKFEIPHRPEQKLKLRIGINSGCVVAGVIGRLRPQYRIFGDTVEVTRELERKGEASRIHISEHTYQLLQRHSRFEDHCFEFHVNERKPRWEPTYWLKDK